MLKTTIIGNIGRDAEVKTTKSGREFLSFSVCHDRGKDRPGVWASVAWFDVNNPLRPYLKKGAKLAVTGDLAADVYVDRGGQPAIRLDIYADSVDVVLFPRREDAQAAPGYAGQPAPASMPAPGIPAAARMAAGMAAAGARPGAPGFGPGDPEYDRMADFLKDDDLPPDGGYRAPGW